MKLRKIVQNIFIMAALIIAGGIVTSGNTYAAGDQCTWTGAVNGNWSNAGNWTGCDNGNLPEVGDDISFPASGANKITNNDLGAFSVNFFQTDGDYTFNGSAVTITGGVLLSYGGVATINLPLVLGANLTATTIGSGTTLINTSLNLSTHTATFYAGTGGFNIAGVISGTGGIVKESSTSNMVLSGNNAYSGPTTITAGSIGITHSNALGTSAGATTVANGATLNIMTGGLTIPEPITITGSGNVGGGALRNFTGASIWGGDITVSGSAELNSDSGQFLTVTGHLAGAATALQLNGKIIFANATNSYTGTLSGFSGADVRFNGSIPIAFQNGGTVGGTGTIGNLTVSGTTSVNPGSNSAAIFSTGSVTLNTTTTVNIELRSGTSDRLNVTGTVNLANAILATDLDFAAADGAQFTILSNDGPDAITGTFAGLAEGATFTTGGAHPLLVRISYIGGTGNDIVLKVVNPAATVGVPNTGVKSESLILIFVIAAFGIGFISYAIVRLQ